MGYHPLWIPSSAPYALHAHHGYTLCMALHTYNPSLRGTSGYTPFPPYLLPFQHIPGISPDVSPYGYLLIPLLLIPIKYLFIKDPFWASTHKGLHPILHHLCTISGPLPQVSRRLSLYRHPITLA